MISIKSVAIMLCLLAASLTQVRRPVPKAADTQASRLKAHHISLAKGGSFNLNLPDGYEITVAAEGLKRVRFMAESPDHRVFVTDMYNRADNRRGAVYILDGFDAASGKFSRVIPYLTKLRNPNSIAFHTDRRGVSWFYLALTDRLVRYKYIAGENAPSNAPETLATFPDYGLDYKYGGWHLTRTVVVGNDDQLYVAVGSSCNSCEETESVRATVLKMELDGKNQRVFARGLRNAVGLKWVGDHLFATNMGADHLGDNKPEDTMYVIRENANYGWPYYYQSRSKIYADPKFPDAEKKLAHQNVPLAYAAFSAHSSPLGLEYFQADASGARAAEDYFLVALHGSGLVRIGHGYRIVKVAQSGPPQDFMTGFLEGRKIHGRPVNVMRFGADGFLLTDDYAGVVYYVFRKR